MLCCMHIVHTLQAALNIDTALLFDCPLDLDLLHMKKNVYGICFICGWAPSWSRWCQSSSAVWIPRASSSSLQKSSSNLPAFTPRKPFLLMFILNLHLSAGTSSHSQSAFYLWTFGVCSDWKGLDPLSTRAVTFSQNLSTSAPQSDSWTTDEMLLFFCSKKSKHETLFNTVLSFTSIAQSVEWSTVEIFTFNGDLENDDARWQTLVTETPSEFAQEWISRSFFCCIVDP